MCKDDLEGRGFGWEDNVEIDIEEQGVRMGMDWINLPPERVY